MGKNLLRLEMKRNKQKGAQSLVHISMLIENRMADGELSGSGEGEGAEAFLAAIKSHY